MTRPISPAPDETFEAHRDYLHGVAYRMLGSLAEADDAVQETWLRLHRSDTADVANLRGWLTTVVARICLDMLRVRKARREEPLAPPDSDTESGTAHPDDEAILADSLGLALLVVLETLNPAERLAFVLHDMFAVSFDDIAPLVNRSPAAARQLASRARRRIQGAPHASDDDLARQRAVIDAFVTAMRGGDLDALLSVLDPDVTVRVDTTPGAPPRELRGARTWLSNAVAYAHQLVDSRTMVIDGTVGIVLTPHNQLTRALRFTFTGTTITAVDIIIDPARLAQLSLTVLPDDTTPPPPPPAIGEAPAA